MKRTVFLLIVLALLVSVGAVSASNPGPHRVFMPLVVRQCADVGNVSSLYEISPPHFRAQVQPADGCAHVEMRLFYKSAEYPNGLWTFWSPTEWQGDFIYFPYLQDVGGGLVRTNELIEFRDQTGHGFTITLMP